MIHKLLARQVVAAIKAAPDCLNMHTWTCGATHCIAGFVCQVIGDPLVQSSKPDPAYIPLAVPTIDVRGIPIYSHTAAGRRGFDVAAEALGLNNETACQLFFLKDWPKPIAEAYRAALVTGDRKAATQIATAYMVDLLYL